MERRKSARGERKRRLKQQRKKQGWRFRPSAAHLISDGRAGQSARDFSMPLSAITSVQRRGARTLSAPEANRSVGLVLVSYLIGLPYVKRSSTLRKGIGNQSDKMHVRRGIVTWPGDRGREIGAAARISTRLRGARETLLF